MSRVRLEPVWSVQARGGIRTGARGGCVSRGKRGPGALEGAARRGTRHFTTLTVVDWFNTYGSPCGGRWKLKTQQWGCLCTLVLILAVPGPAWGQNVIRVAPSGVVTGATDADNIEAALRGVGWRGRVELTDGDDGTVDRYYTNRVVVVEGFSGTITGENRDNTIWTAVPNDADAYLYDSDYIIVPGVPEAAIWATALHLEEPVDWTIQNMSMIAANPVPGAETPGGYFQNVAAWGGNGDTTVKNMSFSATHDTTAMVFGPHIMRGSTRGGPGTVIDGIGNVEVKNNYFENMSDGPVIMWFRNSRIVVKDNVTDNVGAPVYLQGFVDSETDVKNNVFRDSNRGVALVDTPHTTIKDNLFLGLDALGTWFRAPIAIYRGSTDVTIKGNGFYDVTNVDTDGVFRDGAGYGDSVLVGRDALQGLHPRSTIAPTVSFSSFARIVTTPRVTTLSFGSSLAT